MKSVSILGLRFDAIDEDAAIDKITTAAKNLASEAQYVVRPYVEFFQADQRTIDILNTAWLSLPDSVAVQWAAAYLLQKRPSLATLISSLAAIVLRPAGITDPLPHRFAGGTFTMRVLKVCQQQTLRVFLAGSPKQQRITTTADYLEKLFPGINIVGTAPGDSSTHAIDSLVEQIQEARPDIVLVGMGFPLQEQVIAAVSARVSHGIFIGEGGTFDYREFGGAIPRAPHFIRRIGLEWLWRLLREPRRIRRQMTIPRFIWRVHRAAKETTP